MPKSWNDYLEENDNDAARAGEAAARDVAARERENDAARTFRRTFEPVLQELDIPTTRDGATALMERLDAATDTSNRVPQGGLALTAEERARWEEYQQLRDGEQTLTPAQIRERLASGEQLARREQLRDVATPAGARLSVLEDRLRGTNLRVELRDRTENGQPVKDAAGQPVREVRVIETVNGQETDHGPLREYATTHWSDYVPALFPGTDTSAPVTPGVPAGTQPGATPPAPATGAGHSYAQRVLAERQAAANLTPTGGNPA